MKVLVLNYEFPPLGGGAATANKKMFEEFSKIPGVSLDLITSSTDKYREEQFAENIRIYYLDIGLRVKNGGDLHHQSIFSLLKYSYKAHKKIKELNKYQKYDLIHAFFGVPGGFLAMLTGLPYIVSLRGSDVPFYSRKYFLLDLFIFQFLYRLVWRKAKYVVANSQGLRDLAYKTIHEFPIDVIPNGVEVEYFKPMKKSSDFKVVSVSRLIERKGLKYLIRGFAEFSRGKENVVLELYGGGVQREELEHLALSLGIKHKTKFFGNKPKKIIAKAMGQASVFVLPSFSEGMSNSLLEAMASGLPVIVTDVGGTKELVDGRNGDVVNKKNSEEIQKSLQKLYADKQLAYKMGKVSRVKAEKMSWTNVVNKYNKLYRSIIGK